PPVPPSAAATSTPSTSPATRSASPPSSLPPSRSPAASLRSTPGCAGCRSRGSLVELFIKGDSPMRKFLLPMAMTAAAVFAVSAAPARAADIVKLVVPFAAGGPVDQVARIIAPTLATQLGKTVIVENRGGAGGTVGANFVAKSPADGLTVLLATSGFVLS